jgi:hypothetical protein
MLAVVLLMVALPAIFVFEGMSALTAVGLNRETWYDVMAEPALYNSFMTEFDDIMPESANQREVIRAAVSPAYVQSMLNKLVDYFFDVLDGKNPVSPTFDIPAPLADALRRNPNATNFDVIDNNDGAMKFTLNISERSLNEVRGLGVQFALVTMVSATIGFLVWFVAALLGAETTGGRLVWLGISLIIASFGVIAIGALGFNSVIAAVTTDLTRNAASMTSVERALVDGLLNVLPRFAIALTFAGGIPSVIGLVLALVGSSLRPPRQTIARNLP